MSQQPVVAPQSNVDLLPPAAVASLPQSLVTQLAGWPGLRDLPLDGALLYRSGALSRLQVLEHELVSWLQGMQARAAAQKSGATNHGPPLTQQDAQTYATLHGVLQQVQAKYRQVEATLQRAAATPAPQQFNEEDAAEPGQQRQESNVEMDGTGAAASSSASHTTAAASSSAQQSQSHYQTYPPQQAAAAAASSQSHQPDSMNTSDSAAASSQSSNPPTAAASAQPTSATGASSTMHWILPADRRKLPGTRYQKIRTLRKTLFGKVVLYFDTYTQKRVAIKLSNKELLIEGKTTTGNSVAENPLEELRFLRILSRNNEADQATSGAQQQQQFIHPGQNHVLQLLDECEDESDLWTILEFCGKGEFFDIVCAATRFDEARARLYFIQLAQGVAYLHAHLICHLDLSLENMLMDDQDVCKICDFGVARMMTLDQNRHLVAYSAIKKNKPGKIGYMSPELFAGHSFYGHLCDVWAMGIILFISLTGVPPYQLPAISDQRFKLIYEGNLSKLLAAWGMTNIMSAAAKDIISRMLCPPEKRMNIQQVLMHPFVTGQA